MDSSIHYSILSMMDDFGRVFFYNNNVYRAVAPNSEQKCLNFLESQLFIELSEKGLIPKTEISNFKLDGYNLVLEHERLIETLQHEWSFNMLKDMANMVLAVNNICNKYGFELKDAHTYNVLFRGTQPVFVDIGSITDLKSEGWVAYNEFLGSFVIPLKFWSKGYILITRKLLEGTFYKATTLPEQDYINSGLLNILYQDFSQNKLKLLKKTLFSTKKRYKIFTLIVKVFNKAIKVIGKTDKGAFSYNSEFSESRYLSDVIPYQFIENEIRTLTSPRNTSKWEGYHKIFYGDDKAIDYSDRFYRILEIIQSHANQINSLIDLAGNEGYFCLLINKQTNIKRIILADYDANAIDNAYQILKQNNISNIQPVLLNFMFTLNLKQTAKRLKSDIVVALAVTHHLILTNHFSIQTIFERLILYSNRFVLVEFMPLGLWAQGDATLPYLPEWYNLLWFRTEFENYFNLIIEEQLEPNRIVFMGEIKS